MAQIRRADATWNGNLTEGRGVVSASTSGAFSALPVTWGSRIESSDGRTSPEELIAAAHAACFSMAFSGDLNRNGTPPDELNVSAEVTFDKLEKWTVTASRLTVRGRVPGIDAARFRGDRRGHHGQLPDLASAQGQRRALGRRDAGVAAGARPGPGRRPAWRSARGHVPHAPSPRPRRASRRGGPGGARPVGATALRHPVCGPECNSATAESGRSLVFGPRFADVIGNGRRIRSPALAAPHASSFTPSRRSPCHREDAGPAARSVSRGAGLPRGWASASAARPA